MTLKEYDEQIRELAFYFLAAPLMILIGMFIVGSIIDSFVGIPSNQQLTFSKIFLAIGGIPSIVVYYRKLWDQFSKKAEIKS